MFLTGANKRVYHAPDPAVWPGGASTNHCSSLNPTPPDSPPQSRRASVVPPRLTARERTADLRSLKSALPHPLPRGKGLFTSLNRRAPKQKRNSQKKSRAISVPDIPYPEGNIPSSRFIYRYPVPSTNSCNGTEAGGQVRI